MSVLHLRSIIRFTYYRLGGIMKIAICDDEKPFMDALSPLLEQRAESFSPPPYSYAAPKSFYGADKQWIL